MINYQYKLTFPMFCISSPCCCIPRIADKTFAFCPESASIGRAKLNWLPLLDAILLSLFSFHPSPRNIGTLSYSKRIRRDSLRSLKELNAHAQIHFTAKFRLVEISPIRANSERSYGSGSGRITSVYKETLLLTTLTKCVKMHNYDASTANDFKDA